MTGLEERKVKALEILAERSDWALVWLFLLVLNTCNLPSAIRSIGN